MFSLLLPKPYEALGRPSIEPYRIAAREWQTSVGRTMADAIWQRTTRHPSVTLASQEAHHSAAFWFRRAQILTAVPFGFMLRTSPGNVLKSKFERNAKAGLGLIGRLRWRSHSNPSELSMTPKRNYYASSQLTTCCSFDVPYQKRPWRHLKTVR